MGRANNSFTSYVGHAEETIDHHRVNLPEKDLWVAVLCRASLDAFNRPPSLNMKLKANRTHSNIYKYDRDQARHFFRDGGFYVGDFKLGVLEGEGRFQHNNGTLEEGSWEKGKIIGDIIFKAEDHIKRGVKE